MTQVMTVPGFGIGKVGRGAMDRSVLPSGVGVVGTSLSGLAQKGCE